MDLIMTLEATVEMMRDFEINKTYFMKSKIILSSIRVLYGNIILIISLLLQCVGSINFMNFINYEISFQERKDITLPHTQKH